MTTMEFDPRPNYPVDPAPGTSAAQFVHDHRHILDPLAEKGLLAPSSGAPISTADLPALIQAVRSAHQAMVDLTRPVSSPLTNPPQIVDFLTQLHRELVRLNIGIDSPVLTVPPNTPKNRTALDPDLNRLRKTCVGYVDVLSIKVSKEAAFRTVSTVLKKHGLKGAKKTVESWYRQFAPVLDDPYRAEGRYDISEDVRMLDDAFPKEADELHELEHRLEKAVERWARKIRRS